MKANNMPTRTDIFMDEYIDVMEKIQEQIIQEQIIQEQYQVMTNVKH